MITDVRPYFRSIMKDLGFEEWRRSLEPDNIPKNLLKDAYHLKTDSINGVVQNQTAIELNVPVTVTLMFKAGRDEVSAFEQCELVVQTLIKAVLGKRLGAQGILNVVFNQATPEALATTNDNVLISRVQFTCRVLL